MGCAQCYSIILDEINFFLRKKKKKEMQKVGFERQTSGGK